MNPYDIAFTIIFVLEFVAIFGFVAYLVSDKKGKK